MARIKLGLHVADMRGRVGQQIYSINRSGSHYIKLAAQTVANPCSSRLSGTARSYQSLLSREWRKLTEEQRALWDRYVPRRDLPDVRQAHCPFRGKRCPVWASAGLIPKAVSGF